ncbi:MAG: hypothetical protein K6C14_00510 [Eubacterium sp.]|nr:hypothetical protein [Eubacterium sp.]
MISFKVPEYNNENKNFVDVKAVFDIDGNITPVAVFCESEWRDIDRIADIRPAASLKSGGAGIRYTCNIGGVRSYLFLEDTKWFLETA